MSARGFTSFELIVSLAVMSLLLGIAALGIRRPPHTGTAWDSTAAWARWVALRHGKAVAEQGPAGRVLFLPDGRVLGPGFEPLTGAPHETAR